MSTEHAGEKDLVSLVVPIYNVEATLDACLSSIEGQTHGALEVLCMVDGATDGSAAIARAHAARDPRVRVVEKANEGYGATCNRGFDLARGTWVAIVEPDDYLEPDFLEGLLACADEHGGAACVDVVRCAYWRIFGDEGDPADGAGRGSGRTTRVPCPYRGRVRPARQPFSIGEGAELLRHHPAIWAGMYRRGYLSEQRIRFREVPGAGWTDNPFLVETLCRTGRICYTDRALYDYREHDLNDADALAGRSPLVPLTRWNEMMDAAEEAGVTDARTLSALALRGVNYALITVDAAGLGDPDVRGLVERSMRRLSAEVVLGEPAISPAGKRLFSRCCGLPEPRASRLRYYAHLAGEALYRVRTNGVAFTVRTALSRRGGRLS